MGVRPHIKGMTVIERNVFHCVFYILFNIPSENIIVNVITINLICIHYLTRESREDKIDEWH